MPLWGERCPNCGHDKTVLQVLRMVGDACFLGALVREQVGKSRRRLEDAGYRVRPDASLHGDADS